MVDVFDECIVSKKSITMNVESLIEVKGEKQDQIFIKKGLIDNVNSFVACLGIPGQGKSSFSNAFYKVKYYIPDFDFFEVSTTGRESFTKGLWILCEDERRKIKHQINRDIIDVDGFQLDELRTWKYIMIVSFLATDIIILERGTRWESVKRILKIIWKSLEKMKQSTLPRILKTILIQIIDEDDIENFDKDLEVIGLSKEQWKKEFFITIKPVYIPCVSTSELKKYKKLVDQVPEYLDAVGNSLFKLTPENTFDSVSSLVKYIDQFNSTLNGSNGFSLDIIMENLKIDFESAYLLVYNLKKIELLKTNLKKPKDAKEDYDTFISNQGINFNFSKDDVYNKLTFYGSSESFDDYYKNLGESKDYKVDKNIFKEQYELFINEIESSGEVEKSNAFIEYNKKISEINVYFSKLVFYQKIKAYQEKNWKLNISSDSLRNKYQTMLKSHYLSKIEEKKKDWNDQIARAKWKNKVQAHGDLTCVSGHKLTDAVAHTKCSEKGIKNALLYWVDGDENYVICYSCNEVFKIDKKLI